jgi:hypothetical protein
MESSVREGTSKLHSWSIKLLVHMSSSSVYKVGPKRRLNTTIVLVYETQFVLVPIFK